MKNFILTIITCFLFVQCSNDDLPVHYLIKTNQIEIISDTILFNDIKCLRFYDDKVYFTNPVYDHIISLNKDFSYERDFGKKGKGSNELLNINQFAIHDSLVCVLNVSNRRVNIYSLNGMLMSETLVSNSVLFDPSYRFCFIDTAIVGCSSVAESPLSKYDIYAKEQTLFGDTYEFPTPKQTLIRNNRFTEKIDSGFIVVSNNLPYIEIYSQDNLKRLSQYDYSDIQQVKNSISAIENKPDYNDDNSYRHLCQDIYVTNRYLYILLINYSDNKFNVNEIVKFEIYPVIKPIAVLKLPEKYFTTFCVSDDNKYIYTYNNTEGTLEMYQMND